MVCFWLARVSLTVNNWSQSFCRSLIFNDRSLKSLRPVSDSHSLTCSDCACSPHPFTGGGSMKKRTSSHTSVFLYSETFQRHLHIKGNFNHPSNLHCGRYETGVLQSSDSEESEWLFTLVHRFHTQKKKKGGGRVSELDAIMMSIMTSHSI